MVVSVEGLDNNGDNPDLETERERANNDLRMEARLRRLREENDVAEPEEKVEVEPEAQVEEESEDEDSESVDTEANKVVVSDEELVVPLGPWIGGVCPNPDCKGRGLAGMPCIACEEGRILRPLTEEERSLENPSPEESNSNSQDHSHFDNSPGDTTSSNESNDSDKIQEVSGKHEVSSVGTEPQQDAYT